MTSFLLSCLPHNNFPSKNLSSYGKVSTFSNKSNKNSGSFVFSVSDKFLERNKKSGIDPKHNKMTVAESRLLEEILRDKNYCLKNNSVSFVINSRQERVYDATFAHLIEENYNAHSAVPRTYYGECKTN